MCRRSISVPGIDQRSRRGVNDVIHKVVAVGSRSVAKAQEFVDAHAGGDKGIKAYGTYEDVYADAVSNTKSL